MDSGYRIKKKKPVEPYPDQTRHAEDDSQNPALRSKNRKKRLKLPESNMQSIFENILNEANRDETVYKTLCSIINLSNRELVESN